MKQKVRLPGRSRPGRITGRGRLVAVALVPAMVAGLVLAMSGTGATAAPPAAGTSPASPTQTEALYQPAGCNTASASVAGQAPKARCFAVEYTDSSGKVQAAPAAAGPPATALGPSDIQQAYRLPDAGAGMTVAIVDAFGYANAESDLAVFRSHYDLPPCTTDNGCFRKVDQDGGTNYPGDDGGWSVETALDLDAVSSVCPKCHILLVQADTNGFDDLGEAVDTAASLGAVAISNSYGYDGEFSDEQTYDHYYDHPGIAVTVSSGDSGNVQAWPSTNPTVVSVGGTRLTRDDSSRGWTETAWDEAGSGCSRYEPLPDDQAGIDTTCGDHKASADISADADPVSGLAVYNTTGQAGWAQVGGTSLASPLVAAMYALAGLPTPGTYPVSYPYRHAGALYDVTSGTNGSCGTLLCQAGPGWDGPTGLGTPVGVTALTLGESGEIAGTVTDSGSGAPIAGATLTATDADGDLYHATSAADGSYQLYAPVGRYDVTASKFGYGDQKVTGVTVGSGATVTEKFALQAKPSHTVSGYVTDGSGHDWPMRAKITISGYPNGAIYSDPVTGHYSVSLPTGTSYTLHAAAADLPGYTARDVTVDLAGSDVRQDITLPVDASTCSAPGYAYHDDGTTQTFTGWQGKTPQDGWTITDAVGNGQTWQFDDAGGWGPPPGGDADFADIDSNAYGEGGVQDSSLVSPVVDLTGKVSPEVGIDTTYIGFPDQTGDLDLSLDGGATWSTVWQAYGAVGHFDIPIPQAAGQSDVRIRFHFTGSWSRRWEIDNVLIGARTCAPVTGGLVAGVVTDANTGDPLNGATVASDADGTQFGVSAPTPDDAGLSDGYYWLFSSHTGATAFTVTDGRYAPAHVSIDVPANGVRDTNIALDAGHLTVRASDVSLSTVLGGTKSGTLTFGNDGTAPVHVDLGESDAGFAPEGAAADNAAAPTMVVKTQTSRAASAGTAGGSGGQLALRQASPAQGPWTDVADYPSTVMDDAVAYHDGKVYTVGGYDGSFRLQTANVYDPATGAWQALARLPEALSQTVAGFVGDTLYVAGGWNNAGDASTHAYAYHPDSNTWTRIADLPAGAAAAGAAVVDGRLYVVGGCTSGSCSPVSAAVYAYDPGNGSWSRQPDYPTPVAFVACGGVAATVVCAGGTYGAGLTSTYAYTPGTTAWVRRADLPVDAWGAASATANGRLEVIGGTINNGSAVTNQGFAYDPASDSWSALPNANNATYRGGAACGIYKVGGSLGGFQAVQFTEHLPGYDECGGDVPWLSENTTSFDIAPGATVKVSLTVDSTVVSQPGGYRAELVAANDSPYGTAAPVTVTMQVSAPKTWGKVAGTVSDADGAPIAGATVAVCTMYQTKTGTCGPVTYTLKTDGNGHYQLWLDKGFNPLQIIAADNGYTPIMKIAKITKGETTTVDFTLQSAGTFTADKQQQYLNSTMRRMS